MIRQNVGEFVRFHRLLTHLSDNYKPYYFALQVNGKEPPLSKLGWKHPSAWLTFEQAVRWMEHGHNIGIAGTNTDKLVIIDVDDEQMIPVTDILPTLSTRSRSRTGRHHFYFTHEPMYSRDEKGLVIPSAKINIATDEAGEVRSCWQYVVAPGSYVPCTDESIAKLPEHERALAGYYTIETPLLPQVITYDQIPQIYRDHVTRANAAALKKWEEQQNRVKHESPSNKSQLFSLEIEDVLGNLPVNERFASEFHGSDTGKNASFENGLYHCWRHGVTHNGLTALAVLAGIDTCAGAGKGHYNSTAGPSSIDVNDGKTVYALWKYARENGILPHDDPMPHAALKWFAMANNMCKQEELVDGWKLPTDVFMKAKDLAKAVGMA